ncbi:MAG: epoxyqueuosine reductase [Proteobacteria bacterium]|nr:epoxyqueuosine reductase [Pseudomonadota bacterium]
MLNNSAYQFISELFPLNELNFLPEHYGGDRIFEAPLLGVSRGDDPIIQKFKEVVGPEHLTPLEMWTASGLVGDMDLAPRLRILSIVFPYSKRIREEGKKAKRMPADAYTLGRNFANPFITDVQNRTVQFFRDRGFRALAPWQSPVFQLHQRVESGKFTYANWSERHMAFAAGLGTFSLQEALITELGCNVRLSSVITTAPLEVTPRKNDDPYANCLYYARGICRSCEKRCPAEGAITKEGGHDKVNCWKYGHGPVKKEMTEKLKDYLKPRIDIVDGEQRRIYNVGCALC